MKFQFPMLSAAMSVALLAVSGSALAEIRVMCYQDGTECEVTADLIKRYERQNPGAKVNLDVVPYKTVVEQLPIQLAAGQGPDIARLAEIGGLSKNYIDISPYLRDRKYWDTNFGSTLPWMRNKDGDKGIYGFLSQLTMTGPFVNKTLFDQAKVALPGPKATWEEWVDAARKVAKQHRLQRPWRGTAPVTALGDLLSVTEPRFLTPKAIWPWTMAISWRSTNLWAGTKMAPC